MSKNQLLQHNAHLWISDPITTENEFHKKVQDLFCENNQCGSCNTCLQIKDFQHPSLSWIEAENSYTVDQINDIISSVQFKLGENEKRFFIFREAERLTSACCNRLLKTIEEPHAGYYFIFMTNRPESILDTLKSRCFKKSFKPQEKNNIYNEILEPFLEQSCNKPVQFMRAITKQNIKEHETKEIADILLEDFYEKLKDGIKNKDSEKINLYIDCLIKIKSALLQLPVQGSTKIFWKNFYLSFDQI